MAGVTLQQAFQWAALPQYRLIAYQAQYPDWQPQAREEGPINPVHQAISFAIEQWQRGIRLPTGQFGMAEGLFEQTFSSDVNEEE